MRIELSARARAFIVFPVLLLGMLLVRAQEAENPGEEIPEVPPAAEEDPQPIPVEPVEPQPEPEPDPADPEAPLDPLPERAEGELEEPVTEGVLLGPAGTGFGTGFPLEAWAGEPDLLDDLDFEEAPAVRPAEAVLFAPVPFDRNVLRSELLPTVFRDTLEREGFRFGVGVQTSYDSNIFLQEEDEVSDFIFTLAPSVDYRSAPPGVPGQVTFRYTPFLRLYLDESDLNTLDHAVEGTVSYTGARGEIAASASYGRFSNSNRNVGGLVETESFAGGIEASYRISARTTLEASAQANFTEETGRAQSRSELAGGSDSDTWSAQAVAFWQATAKTRLGPSLRYTSSSSATIGDRQALAALLVGEYAARDNLELGGSLGVERVENDQFGEDDDTGLTWDFGFTYQPNDRLALMGELRYEAIPQGGAQFGRSGGGSESLNGSLVVRYTPNPDWIFEAGISAESFPSADSSNYSVAEQTYSASVTRTLPDGAITLDGQLGSSNYDDVGAVTESRRDQDFWSLALRYNRRVFAERASLNASLQWSESSGHESWERFQASLGLDVAF